MNKPPIYFGMVVLIVAMGCFLQILREGVASAGGRPDKNELEDPVNYESTQKRFQELYNQWQAYVQKPEIKLSSRSQDYVNCEPYRGIVALGESGLPYLIQKMEEGKRSSWNQAQFFLWHAAREMSGVNLVKEAETISEQEATGRYIDWWKNSPKSSSKTP